MTAKDVCGPAALVGGSDLESWLSEQVSAGDITIGAAVTVLSGGQPILDVALGADARGVPVGQRSLFCVRCALVKPALALGLARLVDMGRVDPRRELGDHLPGLHPAVASIPLRSLLEHTAGLHYTGEVAMTVIAPAARRALATTTPPGSHDPEIEPVVAGAVGGVLMALLIEAASGRGFSDWITSEIFEPLGIASDCWLGVPDEALHTVLDRLLLGIGIDGPRRRPLLLERTRWSLTDWNPGYGGVASTAGLAALYDSVLAVAAGRTSELPISRGVIVDLITRHQPADPRWWQPVGFGFVRNPRDDVSLRYLPPGAFGFSGNRMAFVASSPRHDATIAAAFIGRHSNDPTLSEMREQRVVELVLDLLP